MDFEKIKSLMQSLDNSTLMDFELKLSDGFYLRMNKHNSPSITKDVTCNEPILKVDNSIKKETENVVVTENIKVDNTPEGNIVKSPIVGTFYSSSSPTKPPYVKIGDKVNEGDVLCIIEAMKVMNEIKSQYSGEIAEILVQNEDMIEYNQPLFKII